MSRIKSLRTLLDTQRGKQSQIRTNIREKKQSIRSNTADLRLNEDALEVVKEVGLKTQQQLQYHISDIASLALDAIMDEPYELSAEFVQRRNQTECDLLFVRDGVKVDPLNASGGGAVDVAAFALRVASWTMEAPHRRNTIILDEPMRFLSQDLQEQASKVIKQLSERLGLQFIIITHESTLAAYADRLFRVSIKKGVSQVKQTDD